MVSEDIPYKGWNLLPHLDSHFMDFLSDKCFNLLFEVKGRSKIATHAGNMAASKYGKLQDGRSKMATSMAKTHVAWLQAS